MAPLEPPAIRTFEAVHYRPERLPVDPAKVWLPLAFVLGLLLVVLGQPALWFVPLVFLALLVLAGTRPTQPLEVRLGQHRVAVRFVRSDREIAGACWEELAAARLDADGLVLELRDGRRLLTGVDGEPGQLAWIVGEVNARVRRHALPAAEEAALEDRRRAVQALIARQG